MPFSVQGFTMLDAAAVGHQQECVPLISSTADI